MPRKRNDNKSEIEIEEKKGSKLASIFMGLLIIIVWLVIIAALIKFDVGGFGSSVMRPIFKDVPVINKILPDASENEVASEEYPYKNLAEAIEYIKSLETQIEKYKNQEKSYTAQIADLQAEVERLKTFEESQATFEQQKQEYYDEVVFGDSALSYDEYKKFYEEIEPDYAAELYKQVAEQYLYDEQYRELADAYTNMKPAKAAAALYEMTGNMDTIAAILKNMESADRAAILNSLSDLDPVFCAKVTVLLAP
ncbi:MAG: hypothetical protein SPF70_05445 [Lachnospiraceae bacterium]|nr:hypothetical protein [Lachnospiraceae bacterium]